MFSNLTLNSVLIKCFRLYKHENIFQLFMRTYHFQGCYFAVGLEKGKISDSQLRASSSQLYFEPHQARLHLNAGPKGNGAWCTARNAIGEYLQVKFMGNLNSLW